MHHIHNRLPQHAILYCTLCGREITLGEEYWSCNGSQICVDCLPELARQEFAPCHETRGKEILL